MSEFIDISPGTSLITAIRAEPSPFHLCAGELIDNSLDANASFIELHMNDGEIRIFDNGVGITKERERALFTIANHAEIRGRTKIGRYGVGGTSKAIQHGHILSVSSQSTDGLLRQIADWRTVEKSGRWEVPRGTWLKRADSRTWTRIEIKTLTRKPRKLDLVRTEFEISRRFYPALHDKTTIKFNNEEIEPITIPVLTDVIAVSRTFPDGRKAHVWGGMLVDQKSKLRQVDVIFAHRVLMPDCDFGCNGYGGINSMFAQVTLEGPWQVTKFKDGLAEDPYQEELQSWVEDSLRPLLEKCSSQSLDLQVSKLEQLLNDMIPDALRVTRPNKKQNLGRQGEKLGIKRNRVFPDSESSSTGPTRNSKMPRGMMIEFVDNLHDTCGTGRCLSQKSVRIQLAKDNPIIAHWMNSRDQKTALMALYWTAITLYQVSADLTNAQMSMLEEEFGLRCWKLAGDAIIAQTAEAAE